MFFIIVFFLQLSTGILSQSVFSPPEFTDTSCAGSNQWTTWFDSNDPSAALGEFEVTTHIQQIFPSFMCPVPIAIEARTISDVNPSQTGDIFRITPKDGFLCLNQQVDGFKQKLCSDYKVRYCCPLTTVGQTTTTTTFRTPVASSYTCGRQTITPLRQRVVGGVEAIPNSWPWIVSLRVRDHFCGGTLIDTRHVLTAAHCLTGANPATLRVVAGLHQRLNLNTGRTQNIGVSRIFLHEQYSSRTHANDIAIIRLCQPVQLNAYVNLICLPGPDPQELSSVTVAGWGSTYYGSPLPSALRQVTMQVTNAQAKASYPAYFNVQRQIGAGIPYVGGKDSCQGDSGGPLMYNPAGQWYLSGVVSFGMQCGHGNFPGVYTRTSAYLNWIHNKINSI
ncbi:unnamed protein product [Adineta steineri]|uniref:Peptidase S1 domain-containing protein n=1 Tax=Adineta steineri TaxID=433720 RepID=A0A814QKS6_9BILA|nr:unnamed protein product [Adineta steineri]CAF1191888.1 unnamed protein product [Adineta steineri]CAF1255375.1 unnamed protein product [Adineta steineri]CAF3625879.1 unnamed protein product [Adineta steineri]CAF3698569.1 unnamed protein product [Adineta steineri]